MVSSSRPQAHRSSSSFGNGAAASSIFGAFGRRPRTANTSRDRRGEVVAAGAAATDYAESSEDLITPRQNSRNRLHLGAISGLPRSNSSSQVHRLASTEGGTARGAGGGNSTPPGERNSRFAFPSSPSFLGESRRPVMTSQESSASLTNSGHHRTQTGGGGDDNKTSSGVAMNRGENSSGGGGSSSSAIGRYLRRYSQGAGKNLAVANEAHAIAAAAAAATASASNSANNGAPLTVNPGSSSTSSSNPRNSNSNFSGYQSGSALTTSQTMPILPLPNITGSPLHHHLQEPLGNTEGAAASLALMTGNNVVVPQDAVPVASSSQSETAPALASTTGHRIRLVPHLEATRSLHFEPIERDLVEGAIAVKIGRFTDRGNPTISTLGTNGPDSTMSNAGGLVSSTTAAHGIVPASSSTGGVPGARGGAIPSSAGGGGRVDSGRIAFKSKVVSRGHAEVWCEAGGKFFIRDTKSSSGTFLNHIRLSHPNIESKPFPLKDGDVVQLGVDYQGGTEEIYRCVKMRVELNRGWQRGANQFNVNALRQLRALQGTPLPEPGVVASKTPSALLPTNRQSMNVTDCCICLFSVTVCQALFIAPCSHVFHFKCIRPLIEQHHPGFSCPLCRTFADLDADVEEDEAWQQALLQEAQVGSIAVGAAPDVSTPMVEETFINLSPIASQIHQATFQASTENSISSNSPRHPSSFRKNLFGSDIAAGENPVGSQRGSSASSASSHHRRINDQAMSVQRPDTAGSAATTVPAFALSNLQNVINNSNNEREDEDEEVLYENPSSPVRLQDRRPSAPISIQGPTNSVRGAANSSSTAASIANGFTTTSPSFNDARTPQNEHFLSTLAEAPLPSRFSLRAMDPMGGEHTLFPDNISTIEEGERRVSNATNNSSQMGTNDAFSTPAQGNSPPGGSSPLSATARSHHYNDDDDGNGDTNTSSSSAHNPKGKKPDHQISANMQGAIDFLSGDASVTSTRIPRRARGASLVESIGSSDRGSSQNSNRDASTTASGKVSRFFKRTSSAVNN